MITKKTIEEKALRHIERVIDGSSDPLKEFILIKAEFEAMKIALSNDEVQSAVIDEISKYGPRDRRLMGVNFGTGSTGAKYDFSEVTEWTDISEKITDLSKQKKSLELSLKAQYGSNIKFASMADGSEVDIKMVDPGKETIKISFTKGQ